MGLNWPKEKGEVFHAILSLVCIWADPSPALSIIHGSALFILVLDSVRTQESHSSFLGTTPPLPQRCREISCLSSALSHFLADHYLITSHSNSHINKTLMTSYIIALMTFQRIIFKPLYLWETCETFSCLTEKFRLSSLG